MNKSKSEINLNESRNADLDPIQSSMNFYSKPDVIMNCDLVKEGYSMTLKQNLNEGFDFIAIPPNAWKHLNAWYSSDISILRFINYNPGTDKWVLDL